MTSSEKLKTSKLCPEDTVSLSLNSYTVGKRTAFTNYIEDTNTGQRGDRMKPSELPGVTEVP